MLTKAQAYAAACKLYPGKRVGVEFRPAYTHVPKRKDRSTGVITEGTPKHYPDRYSIGYHSSMGGVFSCYFVEGQSETSFDDALEQCKASIKSQAELVARHNKKKSKSK